MKDALKRAAQLLGFAQAPAQAEVVKGDEVLEVVDGTVVLEAPVLHVIDGNVEALASALSELAAVRASLAEVTAALTAVSDAKDLAEARALATKLVARKASVVAALGTDRADAFMAATEAMPDAQFDTVMAAMAVTSVAEANKPAFKEVGVDAQADVEALVVAAATSGTGSILAAKYQKQASK